MTLFRSLGTVSGRLQISRTLLTVVERLGILSTKRRIFSSLLVRLSMSVCSVLPDPLGAGQSLAAIGP